MHRLKKPIWTFAAEGGGEGGDGGAEGGSGGAAGEGQEGGGEGKQEQTFTQADLDRIVSERIQRERAKFADYDDLKAKAQGAKTAEEQIADLQKQIQMSQHEALRRRVQAKHGISDEDADLFLTGADEDALTAQAKRLAARESERKKPAPRVSKEGTSPTAKAGDEREFVRNLFGNG